MDAGLLVVTLTRRHVDGSEVAYSEFADHDLGQAVAHMTVRARAMGLAAHRFRAFAPEGLTEDLASSPGWAVVSMVAPAGGRGRRGVAELPAAPWSPGVAGLRRRSRTPRPG